MWAAENIIQSMWPAVHRWFPTPALQSKVLIVSLLELELVAFEPW